MIINDISTVNLQSYKRVFAFGCSFTNYIWPTWADLIRSEVPDTTFINLGKSGAGAQYISSMIVEANQRHKFNETDLIIVQWSTYFREDRYVKSHWITPGNMFTQDTYDDKFIKKFACVRGYIIRDLAIMTSIKYMLESLQCHAIQLSSIPMKAEIRLADPDIEVEDALVLYKDTIDSLQTPMSEILRPIGNLTIFPWPKTIEYMDDVNSNKLTPDYHPTPLSYYDYIKKLGFNLSDKSFNVATDAENVMKTMKTKSDYHTRWPSQLSMTTIL